MQAARYLLDTHTCLWAVGAKTKLSRTAKTVLEDEENTILVSQVSLWEIAIKHRLGKIPDFQTDLPAFINSVSEAGFALLPIRNEHITSYFDAAFFDPNHKDPFDRLLLAIADYEQTAFVTKDEKFDVYKSIVNIIW